jgi:hypothetical protein
MADGRGGFNLGFERTDTGIMREAGRKQVMIGLAIAGVGLLLTVATYSAASSGGGYFIFWGAIIFGLIRAGRGFAMMRRAPTLASRGPAIPAAAPDPPVPGATQVEPSSTQPPAPPPTSSMWD